MMKLYNTLSKQIEEFRPIKPGQAGVYSCGPTVYNHAHIGNLSAYIYSDILQRALELGGYQVKRVMNYTDIDDKTIQAAREAFPQEDPAVAIRQVTRRYEQIFLDDMAKIGNDTASLEFVRATESIGLIQDLIRRLLRDKVAYLADDGVYFDIKAYSQTRQYGQLSRIDPPGQARARIDNDEYDKEDAQDFALWKKQKPGEPAWDFEVDGVDMKGRPGWHVECSAMSVSRLGQPFDIHTGGVDHVFPHHENEIAQSTAGHQPEKLANYFVHNEHLLVDGAKMSKSKHNFYTLDDITKKGFAPMGFRMLILQSHYRSPSNFSWDNLAAAQNRLNAWRAAAELRWQTADTDDAGQQTIVGSLISQAGAALLDNLNTPEALKYVDEAFDVIARDHQNVSHEALSALIDFVDRCLDFRLADETPDIADSIKQLIMVRQTERANGDYVKADEIRSALAAQGVELKDVDGGVIWSRR
jgi:cysteinyl-tRNA synthetase